MRRNRVTGKNRGRNRENRDRDAKFIIAARYFWKILLSWFVYQQSMMTRQYRAIFKKLFIKMPKVQRHHYGSHWCIHGYANFDNIIFRTENKCSKLTFENGEKIKLFKWLWELLCFEMGKILRKGRLSLQFKNVLRVCSFLFYMMAYGSLIYRHQKNASWKTIYRHSEIIKKVEMLK